ncbi:3-hydroxyacyl-ACP dehydratase [Photobacterium angustum]|uniref:ApeI family dehydratase n=1 Tax=Photobacterium angustum TaxID=661 RepID=UPI003D1018E6
MTNRTPTLLAQHIDGYKAEITLRPDNQLSDFKGHFPAFPLLPGVSQIDWAVHFAKQCLPDMPTSFNGMDVIKFQEPILPDSTITLTLEWRDDQQKLHFSYTSIDANGTLHKHSSGKIKLGRQHV